MSRGKGHTDTNLFVNEAMDQNPNVDLDHLARRESEQTEWKENVADSNDVVRTLCAFANDLSNLGGGYVVCGVREEKDEHGFPRIARVGLTAAKLKEIEGIVLTRCRELVHPAITPLVEELPSESPDRRILVFVQPATTHAHFFRTGDTGGKHYIRIGRETREARNGHLRELLVRKGAQEPWDRRACPGATVNDLSVLALRDTLVKMGLQTSDADVLDFLSDQKQIHALVPPLCVKEPLTGTLRPRNFAMLLFGMEVTRFIPGAISLFSVYPGVDRASGTAERHEIAGTLLAQFQDLSRLLDLQAVERMDKTNLERPNVPKYPKRALYEALGNTVVQRDYELVDPTRITAFEDRVEFRSPGPLPIGLDFEALKAGKLGARWRNQALAWFFVRLQLAQAEGQGIPTILRFMREAGSPPPSFTADDNEVVCVLSASNGSAATV